MHWHLGVLTSTFSLSSKESCSPCPAVGGRLLRPDRTCAVTTNLQIGGERQSYGTTAGARRAVDRDGARAVNGRRPAPNIHRKKLPMKRSLCIALAALNLSACGGEPLPGESELSSGETAALTAAGSDGTSLADPGIDSAIAPTRVSAPPPLCILPPRLFIPITLTFDDVTSGTIVDSVYSCRGATMSAYPCTNCVGPHVYANLDTSTGSNDVSIFAPPAAPMFNARYGAIKISFTTAPLPRKVSISAIATLAAEWVEPVVARPFIEAFDAKGKLLAKTLYPAFGAPGWGTWQTLTVSSLEACISSVVISSQSPGPTAAVYGSFDNLTFAP
jgi:hypothetical protein